MKFNDQKIAIIADSHFGVRNNSTVFLEYMDYYYKEVFFPYLKENNIKTILHGGDLFDNRSSANYVMLSYFNKFIQYLVEYDIKMYVIIGNHDIAYRHTNEIHALGELTPNNTHIKPLDKNSVLDINGTELAVMPWINNNNYNEAIEFINNTSAEYLLGHFEIQGMKMYANSICEHGIEQNVFKKFKRVWSGHFHHHSTVGNLTYLGSLFHMTWQDFGDWRGFNVLDTNTMELTPIENEYCLFTRILYDDSDKDYTKEDVSYLENMYVELIVENKNNEMLYKDFVDRIRHVKTISFNIVDNTLLKINNDSGEQLKQDVDLASLQSDTKALINDYVNENVENEKGKTLEIMNEIYNEAFDNKMKGE